ncbi:MAG TPA: xanthine dehydrogenase family protein subunit M [Xanthobacteraceae bacterium]|jgi:carbon-monoxide dehydrogenase medium subunit|nr:xanthine dehydrogenase family protein subunit M [Xanthobacteraceae bacterium]
MYQTTYVRASSLAEAANLLRDNPDAKLISGGQTLVPTLRQRLARASHLVDIVHLAELRGLTLEGDRVVIGATTTHAEVAASDLVRQRIPGLAHLAGLIGDPPVRHLGTIGGSIANNDPAADYPAAVLALNAAVHTSRRTIGADDFFTGLFETALDPGEIVVRVSFPIPRRSAYEKFHQSASRFALVGVFVAVLADGSIRVAVTGAGPCVFRATSIESALARSFTAEAAESAAISADGLNSDIHGSAEFRAHLVPVLAARAVAQAR